MEDKNYVSIYSKETGLRITTFGVGIHGETIEDLLKKAVEDYPTAFCVKQTEEEYKHAITNDLIYIDDTLRERPPLSEEEKRQQALSALDAEYERKTSHIEEEMAKAKAIENEDLYTELKAEREALINEYVEKRGEI
ncbi:hypothetical protein [Dialister invisus]|uniref:hypothetical protein n=1 Tax=Dialister invisus TaxID=218538 RepID=UPI00265B5008|nr:hypothetical protein [Dialister invisus]